MDQKLITTGIIGAGSAILGALSQAMVSSVISSGTALRNERIRVIIDIEEYLDELWDLSDTLYNLRQSEIASSEEAETKAISAAFNRHLDRFYSIWDSRKRAIELNYYFKDGDAFRTYRKIERLYEKSKNKIERLSSCPMINNDQLLGDLLNLEDEIYNLRADLSTRLKLHLTWLYILLPSYMRLGHKLKKWLKRPYNPLTNSDAATNETEPYSVKHGRKQENK